MSRPFVSAAFALLICTSASAQVRVVRTGDDRLTGIRQVDVLVTTNPPDTPCVSERPALEVIAVKALRAAHVAATISAKARSWHYSVVIEVQAQAVGTSCAAAVITELVAQVDGIPEAGRHLAPGDWGSLLVGFMPLLRETALVSGPALEHDAAVRRVLGNHVGAIAAKLRSANP